MRETILQAGEGEFWGVAVLLAVLALVAFSGLFRFYRRVRMIEDTPTSKIRSAAQGYVELQGEAESLPGPATVAPLSQLHCLWYRYRVEARRTRQPGLAPPGFLACGAAARRAIGIRLGG